MAVETSRQAVGTERYPAEGAGYPEPRGEGWVTFAGVMLTMIGILNFIGGVAAIDDANVYVGNAPYTFGDLNTWGWGVLITRSVPGIAALAVFLPKQFAPRLAGRFSGLDA